MTVSHIEQAGTDVVTDPDGEQLSLPFASKDIETNPLGHQMVKRREKRGDLMFYPNLFQFFGGYFHQDWDLDDTNSDDVIRRFQRSESIDNVKAVIDELDTLLSDNLSEEELQVSLLLDLKCYYDPKVDWANTTSWLKHIRELLNGYS